MKASISTIINNEEVIKNYSHANQDLFAVYCSNAKKNGTFLDLGCGDPLNINNTFLLEEKFGWSGLSIDIDKNLTDRYENKRKSKVFNGDCTKLDFDFVLSHFESNHIDYLSLDLEPASLTFECLKSIPFDKIEFSIITYEHDDYRFGDIYKKQSREIFEKNGYHLLCSDVMANDMIFEDWYVNLKYIDIEKLKSLSCSKKNFNDIISL
jgi:hypothetical protein